MSLITNYNSQVAGGHLRPDPIQDAVARRLSALAQDMASYRPSRVSGPLAAFFSGNGRNRPPRGLYIHGGVGRGKSMLMDLFFHSVGNVPKQRVHYHEFMQDVHDRVHRWRQTGCGDPISPVVDELTAECHLICFDEFHVRDITDAMILGRLFEGLLDRGTIIVTTSNSPPRRLYENGLNRELFLPFIELIHDRMDVIELDGPTDYRLERLNGVEVYHSPLDDGAAEALQGAWRRLTDVDEGEPIELESKGRRLVIPQAASGVARFDFSDLCEVPLGSVDYLQIAVTFHTLLIENIPALSAERRDEVRRFINLIDTLYDRRVKLIASADAPPEKLYEGATGMKEFERTVSRLVEMQSAGYMELAHND